MARSRLYSITTRRLRFHGCAVGDDRSDGSARQPVIGACRGPRGPRRDRARRARPLPGSAMCPAAQVSFCSGATEAANHVLTPDFLMGRSPVKVSRLLVSAVEHPAVLSAGGFPLIRSRCFRRRDGRLDLAALEMHSPRMTASGQAMLALQLANNETGVIQPVREAADNRQGASRADGCRCGAGRRAYAAVA
jgi:hypothetical protein